MGRILDVLRRKRSSPKSKDGDLCKENACQEHARPKREGAAAAPRWERCAPRTDPLWEAARRAPLCLSLSFDAHRGDGALAPAPASRSFDALSGGDARSFDAIGTVLSTASTESGRSSASGGSSEAAAVASVGDSDDGVTQVSDDGVLRDDEGNVCSWREAEEHMLRDEAGNIIDPKSLMLRDSFDELDGDGEGEGYCYGPDAAVLEGLPSEEVRSSDAPRDVDALPLRAGARGDGWTEAPRSPQRRDAAHRPGGEGAAASDVGEAALLDCSLEETPSVADADAEERAWSRARQCQQVAAPVAEAGAGGSSALPLHEEAPLCDVHSASQDEEASSNGPPRPHCTDAQLEGPLHVRSPRSSVHSDEFQTHPPTRPPSPTEHPQDESRDDAEMRGEEAERSSPRSLQLREDEDQQDPPTRGNGAEAANSGVAAPPLREGAPSSDDRVSQESPPRTPPSPPRHLEFEESEDAAPRREGAGADDDAPTALPLHEETDPPSHPLHEGPGGGPTELPLHEATDPPSRPLHEGAGDGASEPRETPGPVRHEDDAGRHEGRHARSPRRRSRRRRPLSIGSGEYVHVLFRAGLGTWEEERDAGAGAGPGAGEASGEDRADAARLCARWECARRLARSAGRRDGAPAFVGRDPDGAADDDPGGLETGEI